MASLSRATSSLIGAVLLHGLCLLSQSPISGAAWGWMTTPAVTGMSCKEEVVGCHPGPANMGPCENSNLTCTVTDATGMSCDQTATMLMCANDAEPTTMFNPSSGGACINVGMDGHVKDSTLAWSPAVTCKKAEDIVATAVGTGSHTILAAALTKANLVATLQGAGPFTVFAPTDDAFAAALEALKATKEELLARADLADILKYHVVSGKVLSSALSNGQSVETLQGASLQVKISGGTVDISGAKVTTANVGCSNGVIHVIDKVLLPPAAPAVLPPQGGDMSKTTNTTVVDGAHARSVVSAGVVSAGLLLLNSL